MDTRVNTAERRALTVRDLNLNLMQIHYSATVMSCTSRELSENFSPQQ